MSELQSAYDHFIWQAAAPAIGTSPPNMLGGCIASHFKGGLAGI